jgi:hypothetical protein
MKEVRSPWSTRRADSTASQPSHGFTASHQEPEPEPRSSDAEGEQQMQGLPPIEEEVEEPQAVSDAASNTAGSGVDLGCPDPEHLRQFEALFGRRVFGPDVPGASMGVTGPGDE